MLELLVRVDDANTFRAYPNAYYVVSSADDAGSALGEHDLPCGSKMNPACPASQVTSDD